MIEAANVIVRGNRAYVPSFGRTPAGFDFGIDPVYVVNVEAQEIAGALDKLIATGIPRISQPTKADFHPSKDPMLRAAGVKSWKALAKGGYAYAILWETDSIRLVLSEHDKQGRFAPGTSRSIVFPKDTPLIEIVEAILEDVRMLSDQGTAPDSEGR